LHLNDKKRKLLPFPHFVVDRSIRHNLNFEKNADIIQSYQGWSRGLGVPDSPHAHGPAFPHHADSGSMQDNFLSSHGHQDTISFGIHPALGSFFCLHRGNEGNFSTENLPFGFDGPLDLQLAAMALHNALANNFSGQFTDHVANHVDQEVVGSVLTANTFAGFAIFETNSAMEQRTGNEEKNETMVNREVQGSMVRVCTIPELS
jgi:hypothetical protein